MVDELFSQLTLGLSLRDEALFDNFCATHNEEIISELKITVAEKADKFIYLSSGTSLGKSHLLQACCHYAQEKGLVSVYLPLKNYKAFNVDILQGLEHLDVVCIDDLQCIANQAEWEEAFFHFYNRLQATNTSLIIAASKIPNALGILLPDLVSRLNSGKIYQLQPLTDYEKLNILIKRAYHRGITLSADVGKFILNHYPRNMGSLFSALDNLDKASLTAQRRLTIPFVKEVLKI